MAEALPARSAIVLSSTVYPFVTLRGQVQPLGQVIAEKSRPGVDGHAYRKEGLRAAVFDLLGVKDCESFAAARAGLEAINALRGEIVDGSLRVRRADLLKFLQRRWCSAQSTVYRSQS